MKKIQGGITRRSFGGGAGAGLGIVSLGLVRLAPRTAHAATPTRLAGARSYQSWEDVWRQKWAWDRVAKGTHNRANCFSACSWNLFVKEGIVWREEQNAIYDASNDSVPDFNPRGCQKGACYTELMYGPSRVTVPMKRVGPRGSGQWERISWDQAISEIAEKMVDVASEHGTDTIYQDLGPNFDQGGSTVGRFKFQMKAGGMFADMIVNIATMDPVMGDVDK